MKMTWSTNEAVDLLAAAAACTIANDAEGAREALSKIGSSQSAVAYKRAFAVRMKEGRRLASPAPPAPTRKKLPTVGPREQLAVYQRDGFTCRYCDTPTVFVGAIAALAELYPDQLSYDFNWNLERSHGLLWILTASLDHIVPGFSNDRSNLVTSCSLCNYTKGTRSIEELGWRDPQQAQQMPRTPWDGLAGEYRGLVARAGSESRVPHKTWMRYVAL